jgi:hypothetical protein
MLVRAVICKNCKDKIYSRARHDFRWCSCGQTFVDGGMDYIRFGGEAHNYLPEIEIDATKEMLYDDWNKGIDKYGIIKDE